MRTHFRIPLAYLVFGILWIFFSDRIIAWWISDPGTLTQIQTFKGWLFVLASTALIYWMMRQALKRIANEEKRRLESFKSVVNGAHHILGNYLNQMQLFTLEAEDCPEFDPKLIQQAQSFSDDAAEELRKLAEIKEITSEEIEEVVFADLRRPASSLRDRQHTEGSIWLRR